MTFVSVFLKHTKTLTKRGIREMKKYKFLADKMPSELSKLLNKHIKNGWQPKYALLVPKNIRRRSEKYNEICAIIG